jgi:hypothetical protein
LTRVDWLSGRHQFNETVAFEDTVGAGDHPLRRHDIGKFWSLSCSFARIGAITPPALCANADRGALSIGIVSAFAVPNKSTARAASSWSGRLGPTCGCTRDTSCRRCLIIWSARSTAPAHLSSGRFGGETGSISCEGPIGCWCSFGLDLRNWESPNPRSSQGVQPNEHS